MVKIVIVNNNLTNNFVININYQRISKQFLILPMFLLLIACDEKIVKLSGQTMGTSYHISYRPDNNQLIEQKNIEQRLLDINQVFSSWDKTSELSRLNQAPIGQWIDISSELLSLLQDAQTIYTQTNGYFDVTMGQLLSLWGFYQHKPTNPPSQAEQTNAKKNSGMDGFILKNKQIKKLKKNQLDLSAIAKGYGVDQIVKQLKQQNIKHAIVEIGGEVFAWGKMQKDQDWRIGIEHPNHLPQVIVLDNQGVATSGNYRNFIAYNKQQYGHIFNPKTGQPAQAVFLSVSVIADKVATADAYATAIMAMDKKTAISFINQHHLKVILIGQNKHKNKVQKINL